MNQVIIYSRRDCCHSQSAKRLFKVIRVDYCDIDIDKEPGKNAEMKLRSGSDQVPQIYIGRRYIGGYVDLLEYLKVKAALKSFEDLVI